MAVLCRLEMLVEDARWMSGSGFSDLSENNGILVM